MRVACKHVAGVVPIISHPCARYPDGDENGADAESKLEEPDLFLAEMGRCWRQDLPWWVFRWLFGPQEDRQLASNRDRSGEGKVPRKVRGLSSEVERDEVSRGGRRGGMAGREGHVGVLDVTGAP